MKNYPFFFFNSNLRISDSPAPAKQDELASFVMVKMLFLVAQVKYYLPLKADGLVFAISTTQSKTVFKPLSVPDVIFTSCSLIITTYFLLTLLQDAN